MCQSDDSVGVLSAEKASGRMTGDSVLELRQDKYFVSDHCVQTRYGVLQAADLSLLGTFLYLRDNVANLFLRNKNQQDELSF